MTDITKKRRDKRKGGKNPLMAWYIICRKITAAAKISSHIKGIINARLQGNPWYGSNLRYVITRGLFKNYVDYIIILEQILGFTQNQGLYR